MFLVCFTVKDASIMNKGNKCLDKIGAKKVRRYEEDS